jgi:hypothetical protein
VRALHCTAGSAPLELKRMMMNLLDTTDVRNPKNPSIVANHD